MVATILRESDLDGDPLVVRDEEGLRLRFVVVFLSKEVELGHVGNFEVEHEDFLQFEEVAVLCRVSRVPCGARGLVDHERHAHHVVVPLLLEYSLEFDILSRSFAVKPQELFLGKESRANVIWDDIDTYIGNCLFLSFLFSLTPLESEPLSVDKLVLGEFVVDVLEAEVRLEGVVVGEDHVLGFTGLVSPDGNIQKD